MARTLVGTAFWTDKHLIDSGGFYTPDVKTPEERLRFYAERFPVVEVDRSYYALPTAKNALLWSERTPPGFVFDIEAYRLFTQHQTPPASLPPDLRRALGPIEKKNLYLQDLPEDLQIELWRRFIAGIEPLKQAGKLGAMLFQMPPWVVNSQASRRHLETCAAVLKGYTIAVELRNHTWLDAEHVDKTLAFEREHGFVRVVVDGPQGFFNSVPPIWQATSPELALVRLHGRNAETYNLKGLKSSAERFHYLYSPEELRELGGSIQTLSGQARSTHVLFNNNDGDYAQRNAAQMRDLFASEAAG
jgi:uncharacterized protein YecE (DUF72 family)